MTGSEDRPHWTAWLAASVVLAFLAMLAPNAVQAGDLPDGKTLYVKNGCNKCHSLMAESIEVVEDDEEEAEEEEDPFAEEDEAEPEDLSGIGAKWEHGEDGLQKWLTKKLEIDDKLHEKKFPGPKPELKALSAWLMSLTAPAPE